MVWLSRVSGVIIILFGLYLLGLIKIKFLEKEYKITVKHKFRSAYITSFVFGAAFAVGWTPCIGAVLGAILTLAVSNPSSAFVLLFAYALGLGLPFLLVGFFSNQAQRWIDASSSWTKYLAPLFGMILVAIGVLVFTSKLGLVANWGWISRILTKLMFLVEFGSSLNVGVAFLAGVVSFLSPCVLPLVPAFLAYLASLAVKNK
jgi:cytochrome c-type biogenesis protein